MRFKVFGPNILFPTVLVKLPSAADPRLVASDGICKCIITIPLYVLNLPMLIIVLPQFCSADYWHEAWSLEHRSRAATAHTSRDTQRIHANEQYVDPVTINSPGQTSTSHITEYNS